MSRKVKWSEDFKRYPERRWPYQGLRGMGKAIAHVLLVLCALYAVYAFFGKAELNPAVVESSAVEAKPDEAGTMDSLGGVNAKDGSQQPEDMG